MLTERLVDIISVSGNSWECVLTAKGKREAEKYKVIDTLEEL
jgi:hypothetical protein